MKICYVLKDLSNSGAPRIVLDEAQCLKELHGEKLEIDFIFFKDCSDLFDDFKKLGNIIRFKDHKASNEQCIYSCHSFVGMLSPFLFGKKNTYIYTAHGLQGSDLNPWVRKALDSILRLLLCRFKKTIVMNKYDENRLKKLKITNEVIFISNPIAKSFKVLKQKNRNEKLKLGYFGRLDKQKNILFLMTVFDKLFDDKDLKNKIEFHVGGGGQYAHLVSERKYINYSGVYNHEDISNIDLDLYISSSIYEGFPLAVTEFASKGASLILSDIPGHEMFTYANFFKFSDLEEIVDIVNETLQSHCVNKNLASFKSLMLPTAHERAKSISEVYFG